jgi:hypothetical protein
MASAWKDEENHENLGQDSWSIGKAECQTSLNTKEEF